MNRDRLNELWHYYMCMSDYLLTEAILNVHNPEVDETLTRLSWRYEDDALHLEALHSDNKQSQLRGIAQIRWSSLPRSW